MQPPVVNDLAMAPTGGNHEPPDMAMTTTGSSLPFVVDTVFVS